MTFAIFDSHDRISRRNPFVFGFTAFTPEFFRTLNLGFEVYHNSRFKKTGLNVARMTLRECFNAIKGFRRREHDVDQLHKNAVWEAFAERAKDNVVLQQQVVETQTLFQRQERFATHSHESLLEAHENLARIENLMIQGVADIQRAKRRRFFGRVPRGLLKKYHDYLTQQWAVLKQEREDIVMHVLGRLIQAAKDPYLEDADTLPAIIKAFKAKGLLKHTYRVPEIADNKLTPATFHRFHDIVKQHSSSEAQIALRALPWFKQKSSLAVRFGVKQFVPDAKKSPAFLYYHHNLRYEWFNDFHAQAKIDATLHYLQVSRVKEELTTESLSQRMLCVYSAQHAFQSEFVRIGKARQECQEGLRVYFSTDTLRFLRGVETHLKKQAYHLVNEQIRLVGLLAIAPINGLKNINMYHFIKTVKANVTERTKNKFNYHMKMLKNRINEWLEHYLKPYLSQWSSYARLKTLTHEALAVIHAQADEQELLLMMLLPPEWSHRVAQMRELRLANRLTCLETSAAMNLVQLLVEHPSMLQKLIKTEMQYLAESLVEYLKTYAEEFDYGDQKSVLANMIVLLAEEGVVETAESQQLSDEDKRFLQAFPEVNFFINVMLKLKAEELVLLKLNNPTEIEARIEGVHRFIQRQEGIHLTQQRAKFVSLFCQSPVLAENHMLIQQLNRATV